MLDKPNFQSIQAKWQAKWEDDGVSEFDYSSDKPVYSIDTPPPFPTGEFHLGGTLNWCYIDFAARFKRMNGFNVLFPQGWDCHGFPTEVKVEQKYGKLPKEEFRKKCLEWTHQVIGTMKPQMKQMAYSIDWRSEYYTISPDYHRKVQHSVLKMFEQGLVYKGRHPVLFCTHCESAITKAETDDVERETLLNTIIFKCDDDQDLQIATTRPEMLHACVALLVHPSDVRYKHLVGKTAATPLYGGLVPILSDNDVDKEFGSGIVMVCTYGDKQDIIWAKRHSLPVVDAVNERGLLKEAGAYGGEHVVKARAKIIEDLRAKSLLVNQEKTKQVIKVHDRCKKPIEYINSSQWFIKLKDSAPEIKQAAAAMTWVPEHAFQLLADWADGLEWDWCISRQRVFGIPIPFWNCRSCGKVTPADLKELPIDPSKKDKKCACGSMAKGEESVFDGWIDSSITPLVISHWLDDEEKFKKIYPITVRPQGTDIIRTWAFYSIYRCMKLTGEAPFKDMLINGMVCGTDGKKMSKSLGNYVEAKEVLGKASVDALRQWAALCGSTGKDNVFYWKDVNYSQSFLNKLWNASKFCEKILEGHKAGADSENLVDKWVLSRLNKTILAVSDAMKKYDYYTAITAIHSFFWHDFCDDYLEDVKHRAYSTDAKVKAEAQATLATVLENTLLLFAPFAPYTTEEIYSVLFAKKGRTIHKSAWPTPREDSINSGLEEPVDSMHAALGLIRKFKAGQGLSLNAELSLIKITASEQTCKQLSDLQEELKAIAKAKAIEFKPGAEEMKVDCVAA